jgi:hypothetical protein
MTLQSKKYNYRKEVDLNEFIFYLSDEEMKALIKYDVKKMMIFDDSESREIMLKSPVVFFRQISCILEEIKNIGKGDISNVKKY